MGIQKIMVVGSGLMGLHFFSPVPMMQAVEVVRGTATADDTLALGLNRNSERIPRSLLRG